jgi:hypothetical protein
MPLALKLGIESIRLAQRADRGKRAARLGGKMKIKWFVTVALVSAALQLSCADLDVTRSQAEADALQKI